MTYGGSYASFDTPRFWVSVLLFSVAVPGLFEATKNVRWMNALGDLSYPVYLVHTMVLILFGQWLLDGSLSFKSLGIWPRLPVPGGLQRCDSPRGGAHP